MSLSSSITIGVSARQSDTVALAKRDASINLAAALSLVDGVAAGQADRVYEAALNLAASANQELDLAGALLDPLGGPAVFARIKALAVFADPANTNNLVVGAAASNPWAALLGATHTLTVRPGGGFIAWAGAGDLNGYAVTPGTGDLLRVANSGAGTPVLGKLVVIGASA